MVNGCSATYTCDNPMTAAEGGMTRQCLQSNEWNGIEPTCTHGNQNKNVFCVPKYFTGFIATDTTTTSSVTNTQLLTPTSNATPATLVVTETGKKNPASPQYYIITS